MLAQKQGIKNIPITWVADLHGDFSFKDKWDYPEGVYKNEAGQIICDGFCPPETDMMKDKAGNIIKDSFEAYYRLVDTSHLFYSLKSKSTCYEWAGSNYISASRVTADTVLCYSQ